MAFIKQADTSAISPKTVYFRVWKMSMTSRVAILLLLLVVLPMTGTAWMIEVGWLLPGRNIYWMLPFLLLVLIVPCSKGIAYLLIHRDLLLINRFCVEIKKGNNHVCFDLTINQKEEEDIFISLLRSLTWMSRSLAVRDERSRVLFEQARAEYGKMERRALTDPLTGLFNRPHLSQLMLNPRIFGFFEKEPASLIYIDCDRFKLVNDTMGHKFGDQVLVWLGSCIRNACRAQQDIPFRLGGDEFALLLPGTDEKQAELIAQRIRSLYQNSDVGDTSLSIGIATACFRENPGWEWIETLIHFADQQVYQVKQAGGDGISKTLLMEKNSPISG